MNDKSFRYLSFQLILMGLSINLPLIMIDAPIWITFMTMFIVLSPLIISSLSYTTILFWAYDIIRPVLYVWALVVTISGKQDFFAIAFYILFVLQIFSLVERLIGTTILIIIALTGKK